MPTGLQVINNNGIAIIDEGTTNLVLRSTHTFTTVGDHVITLANAFRPLIAVRSVSSTETNTTPLWVKKSTAGSTWEWTVNGIGTAYVYDKAPNTSGAGMGMQVFDASGQVVFDSNFDPLKVMFFQSWAPIWSVQPQKGYPSMSLGDHLGPTGYEWCNSRYFWAPDTVVEPTGREYAFLVGSHGNWYYDGLDKSGWRSHGVFAPYFFNKKARIRSIMTVARENDGYYYGAGQADVLDIAVIDVTGVSQTGPAISATVSPGSQALSGNGQSSRTFSNETLTGYGATPTGYSWALSGQVGGTFALSTTNTQSTVPSVSGVAAGSTASATLTGTVQFATGSAAVNMTLQHSNTVSGGVTVTASPTSHSTTSTSATQAFPATTISVTGGTASSYSWTIVGQDLGTFAITSGTTSASAPCSVSGVATGTTASAILRCNVLVNGDLQSVDVPLYHQRTAAVAPPTVAMGNGVVAGQQWAELYIINDGNWYFASEQGTSAGYPWLTGGTVSQVDVRVTRTGSGTASGIADGVWRNMATSWSTSVTTTTAAASGIWYVTFRDATTLTQLDTSTVSYDLSGSGGGGGTTFSLAPGSYGAESYFSITSSAPVTWTWTKSGQTARNTTTPTTSGATSSSFETFQSDTTLGAATACTVTLSAEGNTWVINMTSPGSGGELTP